MLPKPKLSPEQVETFHRDGVLVLRSFYDRAREIEPIQRAIYTLIGLAIDKHRLPIERPPFHPDTFDAGFQELIAANRAYGSEVYDAVKHIPAFIRLAACERHEQIFRQLRRTDAVGMGVNAFGIRIDNPFEEKFRANWHQEYPTQLWSLDGIVFWTPLVKVERAMGPLDVCPGSHKGGPLPVHLHDPRHPEKTAAYAICIAHEDEQLARYKKVSPLSEPGDLFVMDFCTLHASGANRGQRSRWTMQLRYFNFKEPTAIKNGWRGSFAGGPELLRNAHPELVVD
jgi:hypothetical protein